jgi:hypothetical protein
MRFVCGVDLGQARDYTAVAIVERREAARVWAVRHLERYALGTPYPEIVEGIRSLMNRSPLRGDSQLVVDATGVGRPVFDLFRRGGMGRRVVGITIHGGDAVIPDKAISGYRVPKRDIVSTLQLLLQQRRIKIAPGLRDADILLKELQNYKIHISESGHDSYGTWRSGDHDDLVFAVGLAIWLGQKYMSLPPGPPEAVTPVGPEAKEFFSRLVDNQRTPNPDLFAFSDGRLGGPSRLPGSIETRPGITGAVSHVIRTGVDLKGHD